MWWKGSTWLSKNKDNWPQSELNQNDAELNMEQKKEKLMVMVTRQVEFWNLYSSLSTFQRTVAYCLRFSDKCKKNKKERVHGSLSQSELNNALNCLIKLAQQERLEKEIRQLSKGLQVTSKSVLRTLHPFCDKDNIIHIGERLRLSDLKFAQQHPIV
ncbi:uncharacterized protein LOC142333327 [Lycorma delicatula]|uniref:uncharacterized protein LOC142333327 n=1 Tax=Lycorma delicatula TaxID=130591 RepID=UPI003F50EF9E